MNRIYPGRNSVRTSLEKQIHPRQLKVHFEMIYIRWKELGLPEQPTYGDNGVHASAGPVEAFRERLLWSDNQVKDAFTDDAIKNDPMGKAMLDSGIELNTIRDLLNNVH